MKIQRKSPRTGIWHETDLPMTEEQIAQYQNGALIQEAFPNLTSDQREFIVTGYTPEDWAKIFGGPVPESAKDFVVCSDPKIRTIN